MTVLDVCLIIFGISIVVELLAILNYKRNKYHIVLGTIDLTLIAFSTSAIALSRQDIFALGYFLVSLYRIINMLRLSLGRMNEHYLKSNVMRTSLTLIASQLAIVILYILFKNEGIKIRYVINVIADIGLISAVILLVSTLRNRLKTSWPTKPRYLSHEDLPDVSVLIPARNETDDLDGCLKTLIASDYEKLEVIVLDDCSQNRHTPEIIRGFAHDGVRFIKGKEPNDTWLPKNLAYDKLAAEASGEYLLFCGVDVRFDRQSIRYIVSLMMSMDKDMVCIMPRREPIAYGRVSVYQAMRYWWELAPPRRLFNRPPVLSSCWVIKKQALIDAGGFEAVTRSIVPEAHFAKELIGSDKYSFRRASESIGLTSVKSPREQRETAVRMRYPQLHRRPENVLVLGITELMLLIMPYILAIFGGVLNVGLVTQLIAILTSVLLSISYEIVASETHINSSWFAVIGLPIIAFVDFCMLKISMWCYEFSVVTWKERNICTPAMHVYSKLPEADPEK